jgi:hypothetical protein
MGLSAIQPAIPLLRGAVATALRAATCRLPTILSSLTRGYGGLNHPSEQPHLTDEAALRLLVDPTCLTATCANDEGPLTRSVM